MAAKKSASKASSKPKKPATAKAAPPPAKAAPRKVATAPVKKPAKSAAPAHKPASAAPRPADPPQKFAAPQRASEPADDGEVNDALLSGPRNVQPYVIKRGEQYMSTEQLDHFRKILLSWKHDLMLEVDRTVSHMKDEAANFPDPNDRATQEEEFSLELRTRDRERKLIRKIDEAIARIEDGSYGYCLETGEQIGVKRLEARPVATLSIEAQERRERREKQYGDRDDRYR
jgi:DnaK suppressor protein